MLHWPRERRTHRQYDGPSPCTLRVLLSFRCLPPLILAIQLFMRVRLITRFRLDLDRRVLDAKLRIQRADDGRPNVIDIGLDVT